MDHTAYLAMAIVTHAVVGYALVRGLTTGPPILGALAGVAPDVDLLVGSSLGFPFVHRGLTHTPLVLMVVLGGLLLVDASEDLRLGVGIAYLSHLVIDSFTNAGVMWLYPLSTTAFSADLSIHSFGGTLALWAGSAGLVYWGRRDGLGRRGDE